MLRIPTRERLEWKQRAEEFGFHFHTMHGEPYWDESVYYQFSLRQIEAHLEAPTEELHQMCLEVVAEVVHDEALLRAFRIPEPYWDWIRQSWLQQEPSLYSRLDLAYDGRGPAKLYENNADTPTSVYETGFWQWLWLEDQVKAGALSRNADQFNSLQEKLVARFGEMASRHAGHVLSFICCRDTAEDRGTVRYLEDCANEAGIPTQFLYIDEVGLGESGAYTDMMHRPINWAFKLYPWEFMLREEFGQYLPQAGTAWLEPPWKCILSNKALLPVLWQRFPDHPNLLPAYFEEDFAGSGLLDYVKKPIFAREGANVSIYRNGKALQTSAGPYGEEGYIYQAYHPLPRFGDQYTLVGSWLVGGEAAGISIREDHSRITQDLSRYVPHIILD